MEFINIYNDFGQNIGKTDKDEAHRKALIHKSICVWIINSKHEILLKMRNSNVMFPDMLDISFSGHIRVGETSLEAVKREAREELGISIDVSKLQYLFSCREYGEIDGYYENEIEDVFIYRADIPINEFSFWDNEVKEVRYVPFDEFKIMVESGSPRLLPYETHYKFLLIALNSSLVQ